MEHQAHCEMQWKTKTHLQALPTFIALCSLEQRKKQENRLGRRTWKQKLQILFLSYIIVTIYGNLHARFTFKKFTMIIVSK